LAWPERAFFRSALEALQWGYTTDDVELYATLSQKYVNGLSFLVGCCAAYLGDVCGVEYQF
jgi:hypothetical protein